MSATAQRLEFSPHQPEGMGRSLALALLAHALLVAALTWGVSWHREAVTTTVAAELWAEVPQAAAPAPPPPEPEAQAATPPAPEPTPKVTAPDPEIALERERVQREQQRVEQERLAQIEREKLKKEKQAAADKLRNEELARQADKKAQTAAKTKQDESNAKALEKQRQENLQRLAGLAGATGGPTASGTALQSAGPSASYGARIAATIKPKIVFTEEIAGNPTADVEVRTAPDGTIVGRKLVKSSGIKSWDDAVLKAIDKTERLPRDTDGRVQPSLVIGFRPKD
jgi:colicin import membrane protein